MELFIIIATFLLLPFLLFFIAFCFLLLRIFTNKSIKNPNYPPVMGTVFHQLLYFNKLYDHQAEVAEKHRTFRLLTPIQSEIYTTDTRNIEHVLKPTSPTTPKASTIGIYLWIFSAKEYSLWTAVRGGTRGSLRALSSPPGFSGTSAAPSLEPTPPNLPGKSRSFRMRDILMKCGLDSIFKVGFGVELNCLEGSNQEGNAFIKAFDDSNALVYWRYVDPLWTLKRFLNIGSEASLKKSIKVMDDFVYNLIRTKRKQLSIQQYTNDKEDILSRFLLESQKDPEQMNDRYLRDIILNFTIAGKDSTANTLSWFFYVLTKHPLVQEKVVQEIREVMDCGDDDKAHGYEDFVAKITDGVLEKMQYLHAALTETLRLYPAVPIDGRCADADDILPDGHKLKQGDGVYYMSYAMGRMSYIWGEDAKEFRPERWLNNGVFQPESPFKFVAFHAGPRICLGKDFAYRQMKISAMTLLHFFRFKLEDATRNVTYKTMFTLHINGGLHLQAIPRRNFLSSK
ncbi:Cytochrome P450 704C1 [Vitis vinifera]|uniref:Cytochrome P450 704C1 n=1 Tax=Vitis vinifera TaxID=29760 RepID=A0A438HL77_VITVI|nr:Cytochrome P450 704C1 [Vitis vinifera]